MGFADVLKLYLDKTKCTGKELSAASGISASALSRYRSGKRVPEPEQMEKIICGLVRLAGENAPKLEEATIRDAFSPYREKPTLDYQCIRGYHNEGKYFLTQNETDLAYYKRRVRRLFFKAKPLMKTYRAEDRDAFYRFEDAEGASGGTRCRPSGIFRFRSTRGNG